MTDLYNAGLEERIGAHKRKRLSVRYFDQCKQITDLRKEFPELAEVDLRVLRSPLNRLNKAFQGFFSRVKNGQTPGFPRFRAKRRYRSFEVDDAPGPMLKFGQNGKVRIRIKGLPSVSFKPNRELPPIEDLKVLRIVRTAKRTEVQLVYRIDVPEPIRAEDAVSPVGIDLGVLNLVALSDGTKVPGRNPERKRIKRVQRKLSRAKRGSNGRQKICDQLARAWQTEKERNRGYLHERSREIVDEHDQIVAEDLQILNLTRSAKGTVAKPGSNVGAKAGLNRSIHDQGWGTLVRMLDDKAERAGRRLDLVPPHHTSQDCSGCGRRVLKKLSVRVHRCDGPDGCGLVLDRDVNAAVNVLRRGLSSPPGGTVPGEVGGTFETNRRKTTGSSPSGPGPARPVDPEPYTEVA
ncbi:MAG: transposase [Proteobacteria bacterium]|nr:transposase [Pseudomonadota bacterium]